MKPTLSHDDLFGRMEQLWALSPEERKGVAIKKDLFTRLLYQPEPEWDMHLSDIATLVGIPFEQTREEYISFEKETRALRATAPVKLSNINRPPNNLSAGDTDAGPSPPLLTCLSEVDPRLPSWLWEDFIPLGKATLIVGNPGEGKTFFVLDIAARLSRGTKWIDGVPIKEPAHTIYLTVEDDPESTIRPRIDGLGGDPQRISVYNVNQDSHLDLTTPEGLRRLEESISAIGNVKLVVIDPAIDFSGKTNPNAPEEVRSFLNPLIVMASRLGFALILVGHLNKNQNMSSIFRAGGSTSGWVGKCRAGFIIFSDQDDKELKHVVCQKSNLAVHRPPQLEFTLQDWHLSGRVSITEVDIEEQLGPKLVKKPRERAQAKEWLKSLFVIRPEIPADDIREAAKILKISESTLDRAKAEVGISSKFIQSTDGKRQWFWYVADSSEVQRSTTSDTDKADSEDPKGGQLN